MTFELWGRTTKFILATAAVVLAVVGVVVASVVLSTPGYAGGKAPNLILRALLNQTPTPIPTPVAAACGVHISDGLEIATNTVSIDLGNDGAAATIQAITLEWPEANGDLVGARLGNRTVWTGAERGPAATIFPERDEVLPTIKAGEQITLTLTFSSGATQGHYIVLLHLGRSCFALFDSNQEVAQLEPCFTTFDSFFVDEQEVVLAITNTTPEPLSLNQMLVFWPNDRAAISSVWLDEQQIAGPFEKSPAEIALPADAEITLQPEQSSKLRFIFNDAAPLVGYTIVLRTDGCESVFSNAEPPLECPVRQEGDWQVVGNTAGIVLQNLGEVNQPIERIWLTYPATNGALIDLTLNAESIAEPSRFPKTSSPASMTAGVDLLAGVSLPPNSRSSLAFVFSGEAATRPYTVQVDFPNECRVMAATPIDDSVPCQVALDGNPPLRAEGNKLFLAIRNTGDVRAELRALQVDWEVQFNGALTDVLVGGVPFWQGQRTEGTATVSHNTENAVPGVEPGEAIEIELTFENAVVPAPYVLRLDFAEGCQLSYATQPDLALPTPVEFTGIISQLPANAFDGVWQITLPGDQVLAVQVTPQTVIIPSGLTPRVGDMVAIRALPTGPDQYLATQIRVFAKPVEPVQFSGIIEEVDPQPTPEYIVVQGVWVDVAPDTDVQGDLIAGWFAEVEGDRRGDGTVLARSIRTTQPTSNARRVDFEGVVDDWRPISDVEALWVVSGMRVVDNRDTTIRHFIDWGEQPKTGTEVRVAGEMVRAGTVNALELWYGPGEEVQEFDGVIRQLPDDPQLLGIWTIEDSAVGTCNLELDPTAEACKRVLVTDSTFLDISEASPAIGAPVRVRARLNNDGNLEALWIRIMVED
ncbi:MAG: hypothetical protein D6791_17040 [Chloroflexi bacterium]|nr:MAG: hypothetical protein D6791_17040 [Chloroflexota bacterium]